MSDWMCERAGERARVRRVPCVSLVGSEYRLTSITSVCVGTMADADATGREGEAAAAELVACARLGDEAVGAAAAAAVVVSVEPAAAASRGDAGASVAVSVVRGSSSVGVGSVLVSSWDGVVVGTAASAGATAPSVRWAVWSCSCSCSSGSVAAVAAATAASWCGFSSLEAGLSIEEASLDDTGEMGGVETGEASSMPDEPVRSSWSTERRDEDFLRCRRSVDGLRRMPSESLIISRSLTCFLMRREVEDDDDDDEPSALRSS